MELPQGPKRHGKDLLKVGIGLAFEAAGLVVMTETSGRGPEDVAMVCGSMAVAAALILPPAFRMMREGNSLLEGRVVETQD